MDDLNVKFLLQNMGQRGAKGREKISGEREIIGKIGKG
jgi:hypothetical protein